MRRATLPLMFALLVGADVLAIDYPYQTPEPQKTGWPLTAEEEKYVLTPEHDRRPGREAKKHLPAMWPVIPTAGHWGGRAWLDFHGSLVKTTQANKGKIDVLLVGDSITQQWGASWAKHFPTWKAVNLGIGGDKTQNVLWRLDHGAVDGLEPRAVVLLIGNNNMFFAPETGNDAAAKGVEMCAKNLREKFADVPLVVVKIFPAHAPGNRFYEDIKATNAALETLKLDRDAKITMLDLWAEMTNADGTLKKALFTPDNIHLNDAGYALYAEKLRPVLEKQLTK